MPSNRSYHLSVEPLSRQTQDLWIANWNGSSSTTKGFGNTSTDLKSLATKQIGSDSAALFDQDFVNYAKGYILCVNTSSQLQSLLASASADVLNTIIQSLVFTVVRMPQDFIGQQELLSSKYEYGEELTVAFSLQKTTQRQIPQGTSSNNSYVGVPSAQRLYMVPRDLNVKGRSLKGTTSTGGGGIGVWS